MTSRETLSNESAENNVPTVQRTLINIYVQKKRGTKRIQGVYNSRDTFIHRLPTNLYNVMFSKTLNTTAFFHC